MSTNEIFYKLCRLIIISLFILTLVTILIKAGFMPYNIKVTSPTFKIEVSGHEKSVQPYHK